MTRNIGGLTPVSCAYYVNVIAPIISNDYRQTHEAHAACRMTCDANVLLGYSKSAAGSKIVKVLPFPTSLSTATIPPCSVTISFTMYKPMPIPTRNSWLL